MPPYGIYTALMVAHEEVLPNQPFAPFMVPVYFREVYRLEPVPRNLQDDELSMRINNMRAIQFTNTEAASEVERAFPTTIECTGGKLRFNAEHDTLSLAEGRYMGHQRGLHASKFARYSQGSIVFVGDWHKIPQKMVFNAAGLWGRLQVLEFMVRRVLNGWIPATFIASIEGFMQFLAECKRLTSFGFIFDRLVITPS